MTLFYEQVKKLQQSNAVSGAGGMLLHDQFFDLLLQKYGRQGFSALADIAFDEAVIRRTAKRCMQENIIDQDRIDQLLRNSLSHEFQADKQ